MRILGADVDEPVRGADGVGGDDHALDHLVRNALQQGAVHERAGVALVGVADHVLLVARRLAAEAPLHAGREARAAAARAGRTRAPRRSPPPATSSRGPWPARRSRRGPSRPRCSSGRRGRSWPAPRAAGRGRRGSSASGFTVPLSASVAEPLDGLAAAERGLDDLVHVLGLDAAVEVVLRLDDDGRGHGALAVAADVDDGHLVLQAGGVDLLAKRLLKLDGAAASGSPVMQMSTRARNRPSAARASSRRRSRSATLVSLVRGTGHGSSPVLLQDLVDLARRSRCRSSRGPP